MKKTKEKSEPTYILSIDASKFKRKEKVNENNGKIIIKYEDYTYTMPEIKTLSKFSQVYKGSLKSSLDIIHLKKIIEDENKNGQFEKTMTFNSRKKTEIKKKYSDIFVNLTFKEAVREIKKEDVYYINGTKHGANINKKDTKSGKVDTNVKKLRTDLYVNGFDIIYQDEKKQHEIKQHYVQYKRSSSKSRNGSCLFIKQEYYEKMIKWSHLGLDIPNDEKIDLASMKAYEALVCSEIESTIKLDPKSILIVKDLKSPEFVAYQSVTYQNKLDVNVNYIVNKGKDKGLTKTRTKTVSETKSENRWQLISNKCSDGESLLDVSIFEENSLNNYGFVLLRQGFFKSAALNTNIVDFFKDHFGEEKYETAIIQDMFGNEKNARDIRMIICPSSLKILKFAELFFPNENNDKTKSQRYCFEHWCKQVAEDDNVFGVVKHEKPSPFGANINQLSYQMINTFPLDLAAEKENDVLLKILNKDLAYVQRLKDDDEFFKQHISIKNDEELEDNEFESTNESEESDDDVKDSDKDVIDSRDFILNMIKINPDFVYTDEYAQFKHDIIENYRRNMRKGKIKTQGDYAVQFGNVWELLLSTVQPITSNDVLHKGRQCYCPAFANGRGVAVFRSPHVCTGNIMYATNVFHEQLKQWFNLTDNIVIINAWDNDWLDRTQGSDFDSDSILLVSNAYITDIAKQCDVIVSKGEEDQCLYPTPVKEIEGKNKLRYCTLENMAEIDHIIANNNIGKVVNTSQLLNSYYWQIKANNNLDDQEKLQGIYDNISICSSLSQIEIDKSKKMFEGLNINKILRDCETVKDDNGKIIFRVGTKKVQIEKNKFDKKEIHYFKEDLEEKLKDDSKTEAEKMNISNFIESIDQIIEDKSNNVKADYQMLKLIPEKIKYKKFIVNEKEIDYIIKKVKPLFFKDCSKDKNCIFEPFICPMDHLQYLLSSQFPQKSKRIKPQDKKSILDLLISDSSKINYDQLEKIYSIVCEYKKAINSVYAKAKVDDNDEVKQERRNEVKNTREEKILELRNKTIRKSTILYLYTIIFSQNFSNKEMQDKYRKVKLLMLSMLYEAQPELMKSVFLSKNYRDTEEEKAS